jgi:hypothetical protein
VIHISKGILVDVRAFLDEGAANRYEKKQCKDNGIPYDPVKREKYYEENEVDDDILRRDVDVE